MTAFGVSAVQFNATPGDRAGNHLTIAAAARAEAALGAKLIVLPELAVCGYDLDPDMLTALAEPAEGPTAALLSSLAAELDVTLACGFCETDAGRLYNAALLVTPDGSLSLYRKLHLFDAEKDIFTPGD